MNGFAPRPTSGFGVPPKSDSYKPQGDWNKQAAACDTQEKFELLCDILNICLGISLMPSTAVSILTNTMIFLCMLPDQILLLL